MPAESPFGDLKPMQSHVGGPFAWPASEPWPKSRGGELLLPVLQLLEADAPPQWAFKPGTDCVQVFWNPRLTPEGRRQLAPTLVYRKLAEVGADLAAHPLASIATEPDSPLILREAIDLSLVPLPSSLRIERVLEYPSVDVLPGRMRDKLAQTLPGGLANYALNLSPCPGSKVGGAAPRQPNAKPPVCPVCAWGMDYLLTLAAREWPEGQSRWAVPGGDISPLGLEFEPGAGDVFVCRRCGPWPASALV